MIAGFEELSLKCPETSAKQHLLDSVRCYEAGAYRSAIVAAYVAVCYDLIEKLKFLAASGDPAAEGEVKHLTRLQNQHERNDPLAIRGLLAFERDLIELFRDKFEFFGVDAFEQLNRLRFDRNRCAHPSFTVLDEPFVPSAELARTHIRSAVEHVLAQPARQGKAVLAALERSVTGTYFPTKQKEIEIRLRADGLENARDSLIRSFLDDLTFGYAKPGSAYHKKGYIPNIVAAVIEVRRSIALPRAIANTQKLLAANDLDATRIGAALCLQISEIGESVDDATKVTLRSWLAKNEEQNIAGILPKCLKLAWLREDALQRIAGLKREELSRASGQLASELLDRAAELYATSPNWDSANSFAAKVAIPNASSFTIDHLEKIFWSADAGHGDLKGSHGFHDFVEALYKEHPAGATKITEMLVKHSMADYAV